MYFLLQQEVSDSCVTCQPVAFKMHHSTTPHRQMLNIVVKHSFINFLETHQRMDSNYFSEAISWPTVPLSSLQHKAVSLVLWENGAHRDLGICANIIKKKKRKKWSIGFKNFVTYKSVALCGWWWIRAPWCATQWKPQWPVMASINTSFIMSDFYNQGCSVLIAVNINYLGYVM